MDEGVLKLVKMLARPDRILVVDDEQIVRIVFSDIRDRYHLEVDFAPSVEEALYYLRQKSYDHVLLDMMLSGRSGMEVLQFMNTRDMDVNVTIMSGSINLGSVMSEANNLGVLRFFNKPVAFKTEFVTKVLAKIGVRMIPKSIDEMRESREGLAHLGRAVRESPDDQI